MKKVLFLTLAMFLCVTMAASAEGIKVSGGYLLGTYNLSDDFQTSKANGIFATAEIPITGPVGAMINFASIELSEFTEDGVEIPDGVVEASVSRIDLLATYALPLKLGEGSLRAVGGYSMSTSNTSVDDGVDPFEVEVEYRGFVIGGAADFSPMDRLTLSGLFLTSVGMTGGEPEGVEHDKTQTTFLVGATYQVMDNISLEARYLHDKSKYDVANVSQIANGCVLGVRMSF